MITLELKMIDVNVLSLMMMRKPNGPRVTVFSRCLGTRTTLIGTRTTRIPLGLRYSLVVSISISASVFGSFDCAEYEHMDEDSDYVPYVDSSLYVWPPACSDSKDACYCHITDYTVYDENNMSVDLLACGADFHWDLGATFRVIATLVPPAGSSKKEKKTQFSVLNYAIDFGYDNDRGFWLCDKYDVWYKLEDPNELYKPYAAGALRFASEFIKLMDALLKPDRHGITHSVQIGERYSCNKSLEYMYQISDHAFDIDVLAEYDPLLCKRLETLFVTGCTLMAQFQPVS